MLMRLGRVIWWVGAIMLLGALSLAALGARGVYLGRREIPQMARLRALRSKLTALEMRLEIPASTANEAAWANAALAALQRENDLDAALSHASAADRSEHRNLMREGNKLASTIEAESNARDAAPGQFTHAELLAIGALVAWALAYVLGGSYWRPPRGDG